jgi:hypothetical protein
MLIVRSTACGLGWALQKFDPPHTLSGSDRVHQTMLGLPLARDLLEILEDASSSLLASSPDPSKGELPLVDNKDIESFKMVNIQSRMPVPIRKLLHRSFHSWRKMLLLSGRLYFGNLPSVKTLQLTLL